MTTAFTRAYNDLELSLAAPYSPGAGTMAFVDLSGLPSGVPTATAPLRLSISRMRDGAKTILIFTGRTGSVLTGGAVAEGKIDIPLDAGDVAQCRVSAGYINQLQDAVQVLEQGGGGSAPPIELQGVVLGGPSTPTIVTSYPPAAPHTMLAGPVTGATSAVPTFRAVAPLDLPLFTNTTAGAVPVPTPGGGSAKFLREDAAWSVPPFPPAFTNTVSGLVPVPAPPGGSAKFLREDATWQTPPPGLGIGNSITGGTAGRVLFEGTGPVLADSANILCNGSTLQANGYYFGTSTNPLNIELTRALSGVSGDYVELGSFSFPGLQNGAMLRVTITTNSPGAGYGAFYAVPYSYISSTPSAQIVPAAVSRYGATDVGLDISGPTLRLRYTRTAATFKIRIENLSETAVGFVESFGTGHETPSVIYQTFFPLGPGTTGVTSDIQPVFTFYRPNSFGNTYPQVGQIKIANYASGAPAPNTQIILSAKSTSTDAVDTDADVLFVNSNYRVGVNQQNPSGVFQSRARVVTDTMLVTEGISSQTGPHYALNGVTSTSAVRTQAQVDALWSDSTDSTRKGALVLRAVDFGGNREGLRIGTNGTNPLVGAFGATPVAKPAVTGSRGGNAALASLLTALASLGWITDSTTA